MKNIYKNYKLIITVTISLCQLVHGALAAETRSGRLEINQEVDASRLVPLSLSGFTGEALSTLKFDLEVMGCSITSPETAQFQVTGSNQSNFEGRVVDRISQRMVLGKAYSGASPRVAAHTFANEIIQTIMPPPNNIGIARTQIAFKVATGDTSEIYIADYDGHSPVAVTADHSLVAAPTWMPGHRVLFYTSYKLGNPDIYSQNLDTGDRRVVARYTGLNTSAAISPDGKKVAMILSKAGSPDLYVANVDGSNLKQLTFTRQDESSPCWAPDGRTLCFASRVSGRAALYTIPATGGTMKRVSTDTVGNVTEPDWSPDGKTIAFTTTTGGFTICTVPAPGGTAQILAPGEDPTWAPNSRTLIFAHRVGNKYSLSLLDVPTKQVKNIAQISGNCSQPSWAR